ncbi:hypothetical protein Bpfe_024367 [Biomphalaria pfeifferi]|uniref:Uncharacterized protein n=1 Tax=Biomphalaria pfeifferi TaxID=112525 RepID=A0AAD8B170_BIOPF|nr:hypothetical protein Bpfe_024367 [Biomphalaria pfeifferi]
MHIFGVGLVVGLLCQLAAIWSDSWVVVDRYVYPYWDSLKGKVIYGINSNATSWFLVEKIANAGLWRACYFFPHLPYKHTSSYCADFFDDYRPERWFTILQILCLLSPALSLLGSLHLAAIVPACCFKETLHWLGTRLLVAGGFTGTVAMLIFHTYVTKEFIVFFDWSPFEIKKDWAFLIYLDGSLLHLVFGLLYVRERWSVGITVRSIFQPVTRQKKCIM